MAHMHTYMHALMHIHMHTHMHTYMHYTLIYYYTLMSIAQYKAISLICFFLRVRNTSKITKEHTALYYGVGDSYQSVFEH